MHASIARRLLVGAATAALFAFAPVASAEPNLVANGDFETGSFSGWTRSGTLDYTEVDCFGGCFGSYALDTGAQFSLGFISQRLATVTGARYELSFWLQGDGAVPNEVRVDVGNATVFDARDIAAQGFTRVAVPFVATAALTDLRFGFRSDPGFLQLDDIVVQAVPEPGAWALLALGLGFLAWRRFSGRSLLRP